MLLTSSGLSASAWLGYALFEMCPHGVKVLSFYGGRKGIFDLLTCWGVNLKL